MTDEWGLCLSFAVMGLGLSPEAFWRLSLREWLILTRAPEAEALSRADFTALMQIFPDEEK